MFSREEEAEPLSSVFPVAGVSAEEHAEGCADQVAPKTIDLSNGPTVLDLESGEKVETIESKNPSSEFQTFSQMVQ